jgi:hypothetical protein
MANGHRRSIVLASVLVFTSAVVRADNPYAWWTHLGAMGTPTSSTASLAQFNDAGTISIKSSVASGTLRVKYNVTAVDGVLDRTSDHQRLCLMMVARADTSDSRVIATLYRQTIDTNQPRVVIGTIDSAHFPADGVTGYRMMTACDMTDDAAAGAPLESLNFAFEAYFIEAQLIKKSSAGNPGLQTVAIGHLGT